MYWSSQTFTYSPLAYPALLYFYETSSSGWRIQQPTPGQMLLPFFPVTQSRQIPGAAEWWGGGRASLIALWINGASKPFPPHGFAWALLVAPAEPYGPGTLCSCESRWNMSHTHHCFTLHQHMSSWIHSTASVTTAHATNSTLSQQTHQNYLNVVQFFCKQRHDTL